MFNLQNPAIIVPAQLQDLKQCRDFVTRARQALAENPELFDVIEWRVDALFAVNPQTAMQLVKINAFFELLQQLDKPILATLRSRPEGGLAAIDGSQYTAIVGALIQLGVHAVDIELRAKARAELISLAKRHKVCTVVSHHNWGSTPSRSETIMLLAKITGTGADIAKIAVTASHNYRKSGKQLNDLRSAGRAFSAVADNPAAIIIAMGPQGKDTRLNPQRYGSCATFAAFDKASAPGQINVHELVRAAEFQKR